MEWHIRLSEINPVQVPVVPFTKRADMARTPLGAPALRPILPAPTRSEAPLVMAAGDRAAQLMRPGHTVWRVTMVLPRPPQDDEIAFKRYLAQQGMAVDYETVMFSGDMHQRADLIARVRATRPDLIYTWGTPSTLAVAGRFDNAQAVEGDDAIRDIPIVFAEVTDPVGAGLVRTLASPDRNVTGVPHIAPMSVQLGLLSAYRPFSRIGFIDNPREQNSGILLRQLKAQANAQGMQVVSVTLLTDDKGQLRVSTSADKSADKSAIGVFHQAIASLQARGAQVLYVGTSTLLAFTYRDALTQAALDAHLPTFCSTESILRQSQCLYGIYSDGRNIGTYAAYKAEEILVNGQSAAHIAASPLERFSILINVPVASRLDLYPPISLLPLAQVVPAEHVAAVSNEAMRASGEGGQR
jgi:putative ABC transport system substrate-binding protein